MNSGTHSLPFFSIIIPTYNSEKYIGKCLESIRAQGCSDYEIIIQDGLSKDRTPDLIKEFIETNGDSTIILASEKDNGIYDAMNRGIAKAKGSWLLFLGSDDHLYDDEVLGDIRTALQQSSVDMLYGDVKINGHSHWAADGEVYAGEFTREKLFQKNICHQAIFYNRTIFEKLGSFETRYTVCADWDLNHRCFAGVRTAYTPRIVSNFFSGGESTGRGHDDFTDWESGIKLKRYYRISYFNRLLSTYSSVFSNAANVYLNRNRFAVSVYYFIVSWYHSKKRMKTVRNYAVNIYIYLQKKLRFRSSQL